MELSANGGSDEKRKAEYEQGELSQNAGNVTRVTRLFSVTLTQLTNMDQPCFLICVQLFGNL